MTAAAIPLFHLYGDPPDDQVFDFVHIETIASRSSLHDWIIRTHRHRNLFQILLIEHGGGEMAFEAAGIAFEAPCAILVPATIAHGFRFLAGVTDGWVMTFTEDVTETMDHHRTEALTQLKALAAEPVVPIDQAARDRLSHRAAELHDEHFFARPGFRIATRGLLALIAVEVARLAGSRERTDQEEFRLEFTGATVETLRKLIEEHFRKERQLAFYAEHLAMTVDRLNDHVKRAMGVTAGHLLRQRVITEAKRQLVFTDLPIGEIAYDLAFSDPAYFARFFRRQTGTTPHDFRAAARAP